jgi:hypothetical protein
MKIVGWSRTQQLGFTLFNPTYGSPFSRESDSPIWEDTDNENCRLGRDPTVGFHFVQPNLRKPIFKGAIGKKPDLSATLSALEG